MLVPPSPISAAAAAEVAEPVVVRFDDRVSERDQAAVLAAEGLVLVDRLPGSDFALALPGPEADGTVGPLIDQVAPLVTYRAAGIPDDPAYPAQWHLPAVDASSAWDVTDGTGTIVAVIDTGVAYESDGPYVQAPDLAGTAFAPGWDFVDGDAHPNDENGHGTHVTGSIAETTGNGLGGAGLAPGATIMPLRVLDGEGAGSDFSLAQAIRYAADHGASVANMSLGGASSSAVVRDAIAHARERGVVLVGSSGNDGAPTVSYPAAEQGVIAVGAVRQDLTRPAYSSYGSQLDLVAPGGDLTVDQDRDGYADGILQQTFADGWTTFCMCFLQGTSMAAPQVSAVAALVAATGVTDPVLVEQVLTSSAVDLGPVGRDDQYGAGLVQAGAAVRALLPGVPVPVPELEPPLEPVLSPVIRSIDLACPPGTTPESPFTDVDTSVHRPGISCAAWWGVASGLTPTSFAPAGSVTRGQLASFVARTLAAAGLQLPVDAPDAFTDDDGSVHERSIDQLAALRVVQGRGAGTFDPKAVVTRAETATFLVRAHDALAAAPLAAGTDRFTDDDASVHAANIDKMAAAGLAGGVAPGTYAPAAPVQRAQMATFLARTLDLFVADGDTRPR